LYINIVITQDVMPHQPFVSPASLEEMVAVTTRSAAIERSVVINLRADLTSFGRETLTIPSFDYCGQRGHGRHARTAQSDHSIDVLGARLDRHVNVPHLRDRCYGCVVI